MLIRYKSNAAHSVVFFVCVLACLLSKSADKPQVLGHYWQLIHLWRCPHGKHFRFHLAMRFVLAFMQYTYVLTWLLTFKTRECKQLLIDDYYYLIFARTAAFVAYFRFQLLTETVQLFNSNSKFMQRLARVWVCFCGCGWNKREKKRENNQKCNCKQPWDTFVIVIAG